MSVLRGRPEEAGARYRLDALGKGVDIFVGMLMHLIYRKGGVHLMSIGEESAWYHMGGRVTLLSLHIHKLWNDLALSQVLCSVTMCARREEP